MALMVKVKCQPHINHFYGAHIPNTSHQFLVSSLSVSEWTHIHTDGRMPMKAIPCFAASLVCRVCQLVLLESEWLQNYHKHRQNSGS